MTVVKEPEFLHFQTLVDQARTRIQSYCPEWTELNLSDPGVTLIELFAYMTSQLNYRLNRIPERNYLEFLRLVGIPPEPPQPARTELTFYLSVPFPLVRATGELDNSIGTRIPANTAVGNRRATGEEEEIIFITEREGIIRPPRLQQVRRRNATEADIEGKFGHDYLISVPQRGGGETYQLEEKEFRLFDEKPRPGNAFYLGFTPEQDLAGYYLVLDLDCQGPGVGVDTAKPPLVWECSLGDDLPEKEQWGEAELEEDTTEGLTQGGEIRLHLPAEMKPTTIQGRTACWLRGRLIKDEREDGLNMYTESPLIKEIRVAVAGITIPAVHSTLVSEPEVLGRSSGEAGQQFQLRRFPVLPLESKWDEYVEVEERYADGASEFLKWEQVEDFANSTRYDRYYALDHHRGVISFGPALRQPDGEMRQYGQIPKLGHRIRITRYRTGGGARGNVPAGSLRVLKKAINYIVDVNNRSRASGGLDQESLAATRLHAQEILRGRQRAVTAEDYEWLCSRLDYVARVKCLEPAHLATDPDRSTVSEPGRVLLLVVPQPELEETQHPLIEGSKQPEIPRSGHRLEDAYRLLRQLKVRDDLKDDLRKDLDRYRLLGITLDIREPEYKGVKIEATISARAPHDSRQIREAVVKQLREFITPLKWVDQAERLTAGNGTLARSTGSARLAEGWPFGQPLYISDVYATIQAVEGVAHVTDVKLCFCSLDLQEHAAGTPPVWSEVTEGMIKIPEHGLLYLLDCQVTLR